MVSHCPRHPYTRALGPEIKKPGEIKKRKLCWAEDILPSTVAPLED